MASIIDPVLETLDGVLAWMGTSIGQTTESYCQLETATDNYTLVAKDGSLVSVIKIHGATFLVGPEEFERIHNNLTHSLRASLGRPGHAIQVYFYHDREPVTTDLHNILEPARQTAKKLDLDLADLFEERVQFLKNYCNSEEMYFVLWTRPSSMTKSQNEQSIKDRIARNKKANIPPIRNAQNFLTAIPELKDTHNSLVQATLADLSDMGFKNVLLNVHEACYAIRRSVDKDFTDIDWQAYLPGDKIPIRETKNFKGDISDLLWPPLSKQLIPRNGKVLNLRTARIGDKIYGSIFIDLFPKELIPFVALFKRIMHANLPWRISYMLESDGIRALGIKPIVSAILSFASTENQLINSAVDYLKKIDSNTDEVIVRLKITATTWAKVGEEKLLHARIAELAKAIQGWGHCETSEICGDAFAGVLSSALGITTESVAVASIAPLEDVTYMLPLTRPASPWTTGAILFRSLDGKPWPYQPGSTLQTTWIDIIYARPGSGKSVLSNSINLALCLSGGLQRLPRIAIIDIGPSSSGLISLLQEALPADKKHLVAYHRLRMTQDMSINPFDTQLGCRFPSPQDRAFLVNFLTLLATPIGEQKAYDGIADMAGLIVDELYKKLADNVSPRLYTSNLEEQIDKKINELELKIDDHTTWWEITDELFKNGEIHLAGIAQRYASPLLADAASICRDKSVEDLYGEIKTPTGETLINAFGRMISSAVREYPILSKVTSFDLGETKIVSLDLDEVAKSGGDAADRQTAIMYMLARYILARHYYITEDNIKDVSQLYRDHHAQRVKEIREEPKRIVFDEFHRTSKAQAVRDQVIVDMREGRKWKVQVALLSQSLDDFDPIMVEFATAIFIMDAGPKQAIEKSTKVFGLSDTAKLALETKVHGPRHDGSTFLAVFSTKTGVNTQLITSTIGPIELWAFSTTAEDVRIRNTLYERIGAAKTRRLLAKLYPSGSAAKVIEERLTRIKKEKATLFKDDTVNVIDQLVEEIMKTYEEKRFEL